jgi:ADP-glucose pyrophosphorylase
MAEPNRKKYIEILQKMTGEERVRIAFELFEFAKDIMIEGMKAQNPNISQEEIQQEVVRRMMRCHKRNSLIRSYKFLTN